MTKPELRQFGDLSRADFERHAVWIGVHNADYGEPWYKETDEETYRPWTGALPAAPAAGTLLVLAVLNLQDGTQFPGFVTPAPEGWDKPPDAHFRTKPRHVLGRQQPHIFVGEKRFDFWGGNRGIPLEERQALYIALGRTPEAIFPLRFTADSSLATGNLTGQVHGFYRRIRGNDPEIEL